jgi:hypothetical protein
MNERDTALTIWKFPLEITGEQEIETPNWFVPLSVGFDPFGTDDPIGVLCLWAQVLPKGPAVKRRIHVRGTGHPIDPAKPATFVGTAINRELALVWHVFDGGQA